MSFTFAFQTLWVESQLQPGVPEGLLIAFAIVTALIVVVFLAAVLIGMSILPYIEQVNNQQNVAFVDDSPHDRFPYSIQVAWLCTTALGIFLYLINTAIAAWLKFYTLQGPSKTACWASTAIIVVAIVVYLVFVGVLYRQLFSQQIEVADKFLQESLYSHQTTRTKRV